MSRRESYVFPVDEKVERFAVEPVAVALGALEARVKFAAPFLRLASGVVALLHLDVFHQTLVGEEIVGYRVGLRLDLQPLGGAVEYVVESIFGQILHRGLQAAAIFLAYGGYLPENHGVFVFA